jgi:hypothetical protein
MNGLRRAFLVIYSLLLIAAAGGLIALVWNQDQKLDLSVGDFNFQAFATSTDSAKWLVTVVLAAIALIGFISLILAVMRTTAQASKGTLRMKQTDGGTVEVTSAAIENLLRDELGRLPDVRTINPRVRLGSGGAVDTNIDATIEPSASIASVTNELSQGVANVLREQVGVTNVRRPNIRISYDEMNARPIRGGGKAGDGGMVNGPARQHTPGAPVPASQFNPPLPRPPEPMSAQDAPRAPEPLGPDNGPRTYDAPRTPEPRTDEDFTAHD